MRRNSRPIAKLLVGVDEAGRGPLAGPIAVAVLCVRRGHREKKKLFKGIRDSKKFSERQREAWFARFKTLKRAGTINYAVAFSGAGAIDAHGIVGATKRALARALKKLVVEPDRAEILLDGSLFAPRKYMHQKTFIRGDDRIPIIAAASIIAKVLRDRKMKRLAKRYPEYGFDVHKGYGTREHYEALKKHGPCIIHRRSFLRTFHFPKRR